MSRIVLEKMSKRILTLTIVISLCTAFALPKLEGGGSRILEKPLSAQEHFVDGEHNAVYDHEAFLGDEAKTFDDLTPEESKRRLGLIFEKIDKNQDGFVDSEELKMWIQWTQRRYIVADAKTQWKIYNPTQKDKIMWTQYKKTNYGFLDEDSKDTDNYKTYSRMLERDRRRWVAADLNKDDSLTLEEFQAFLHPEEVAHMQDIVVIETVEDIDKDGDGRISVEEYISDLYRGEPGEEEPSWVQAERDTFAIYRDKNGDGFLDRNEVKHWILPDDFDHAQAETNHLIHASDSNADGKLTKDEVLEKFDIFVGSQATDFGEALIKHEEF